MIRIKPAPGNLETNFKRVGSIPCGFNAMGTQINDWQSVRFDCYIDGSHLSQSGNRLKKMSKMSRHFFGYSDMS